jgi:hypothetical protein
MTILLGGAGVNKCKVIQLTAMIIKITGMEVNVMSFQETPAILTVNEEINDLIVLINAIGMPR